MKEREKSRSDPGFVAKAQGLGWERLGKSSLGESFGIWFVTHYVKCLRVKCLTLMILTLVHTASYSVHFDCIY